MTTWDVKVSCGRGIFLPAMALSKRPVPAVVPVDGEGCIADPDGYYSD
jgi:hypothetical protein